MVLSGSKRTTYMSSIVNRNSGGGPKKAGLPYQIGREAYTAIHMGGSSALGVRFSGYGLNRVATTANPNVKASRPISVSPMVWR
jgi:hypothetical protein